MIVDINSLLILIGILANLMAFIGAFTKLENRLTKLETTMELLLNNLVKENIVERRK